MDVVIAKRVSKRYGSFALQDVSFRVPEGTIVGFIGRNGAGKTTTLRLLLALAKPSSGCFAFFGKDANASEPQIRAQIGAVLDGGTFFEDLRIEEMKKILAASWPSWSEKRFHNLLDLFELHPRQRIRTLSRGMHAELAFAFALSHRAQLLILDEPTAGLDPLVRRDILTLLKEFMQEEGQGVLLSTHITTDLERIADEIVLIEEGKIIFQRDRDSIIETHRLVKGPLKALTPSVRRLLGNIQETPFGFQALTAAPIALKETTPGLVFERPSLEDIMASYVQGGSGDASIAN